MTARPPATVTVCVVNYNGGDLVLRALQSLHDQTFRDIVVVVVDNDSTDGSADRLAESFPAALLLRPGRNLGFAAANNLAMASVELGEFVAMLNPDAEAHPHWLEELVAAAGRHPQGGSFGSRMYRTPDKSVLDGVGDVYHVSGISWREGHRLPAAGNYLTEREIFSASAAAVLYRTSALADVGGFDERFFMYLEDVDLGFRLRLRGWEAWYVPTAEVLHHGSAIVGEHSDFQIYHGHRNLVWTYVQDMPGRLLWSSLPWHLALNAYTLAAFTLQGHGAAIWRAKVDAVRGLRQAWQRRAAVQASRRVDDVSVRCWLARGVPRRRRSGR